MTIDRTNEIVALALALIALLGALLGWLRWIRPRLKTVVRRVEAAVDTIAGRDAIVDNVTGKELAPELPSIGKRMDAMEGSVSRLVDVIEDQHRQDQRIDDLERRVEGLESAAIERVAGKAESVAAFRAIEAVAKQHDPATPEIEEQP